MTGVKFFSCMFANQTDIAFVLVVERDGHLKMWWSNVLGFSRFGCLA